MLNELYQVYKSMVEHDIGLPYIWHEKMKGAPSHDIQLAVSLNPDGEINSVVTSSNLPWKDVNNMRAFELSGSGRDAGARFPVIVPQYKVKDEKTLVSHIKDKDEKKAIIEIKRLDNFKRILKIKLDVFFKKLMPYLTNEIKDKIENNIVVSNFLQGLEGINCDSIIQQLFESCDELELLVRNNKKILISFELYEWDKFGGYPINHTKTLKYINNLLLQNSNTEEDMNTRDSFGNRSHAESLGFEPVKIQEFNDIYPRSSNKNVPSFFRWEEISDNSFYLGQESKDRIIGALSWITSNEFKEKTWKNLKRITGKSELLIAYTERPNSEGYLLDALCPNVDTMMEEDYIETAKQLIKTVDAISQKNDMSNISYFSIRNTSNNTAGIHNYGDFTVEHLNSSARGWQEASKNIPVIFVYQGKEKLVLKAPFPAEVVKLVNVWSKEDGAKKEPRLLELEDVFYLFLGSELQKTVVAERLVRLLINRPMRKLLKYTTVFRAWYPEKDREKLNKENRKYILKLPLLLAIGLFKLNLFKEQYMLNSFFLLGQYLALIDEANFLYYQVHNKGKTPKSLLGNNSISSMLENPRQCISTVGERASLYIGWIKTKTIEADEDGKKLANLRYRIEANANQLLKLELSKLPKELNEVEKAQLILGYFAGANNQSVND